MIKRMQRRLDEARNNENGFTLIELLIVIVVLGILAGIVVLGLGTFRADASSAACNADAKQVQIASDAYRARPSNTAGTPATAIGAAGSTTATELVGSGLLKEPPSAANLANITYTAGTGQVTDSC